MKFHLTPSLTPMALNMALMIYSEGSVFVSLFRSRGVQMGKSAIYSIMW